MILAMTLGNERGCAGGLVPVACWTRSSRYIRQHSQSRRSPPVNRRPTTASKRTAISANAKRINAAATTPSTMARRRSFADKPTTASPITTALSPASIRSIARTWPRTVRAGVESRLVICAERMAVQAGLAQRPMPVRSERIWSPLAPGDELAIDGKLPRRPLPWCLAGRNGRKSPWYHVIRTQIWRRSGRQPTSFVSGSKSKLLPARLWQ